MSATLTFDECRSKVAQYTNLTLQDIDDAIALYNTSMPDFDALVQGYKNSFAVTDPSAWRIFRDDLSEASEVVKDLLPISALVAALMVL